MKYAKSRFISILLIFLLIFSSTVTAFADDNAVADKEDQKKQEEQQKAKQEAEKKAAEEKAKKEAEAKAAAEKAKQEAEAKAAAEKAKKEAEEAAAEKAKQEAEAKAAEEKQEQTEASNEEETPQVEQPSADSDSRNAKPDKGNSAKASDASKKNNALKLNSELSDGTYKPEATITGGSGRVHFTCDKIIIKDGSATAVFQVDKDLTHLYMGTVASKEENPALYDPKTGATGKDVYTFLNRQISVPVTLNEEEVKFTGRNNAMSSKSRWIEYEYTLIIKDESQKISDDTTIPENGTSQPEEEEDPEEPEEQDDPKDKTKLKDGTYKVNATTCRVMFYLYPKEKNPAKVILVKKNGKMTATITLTGTGYDYVYMGTPKQAKKAGKKKWIKYKKVNGYYTFKIPVSKLNKKLPITPHSSKYASDGDPSTDPWRPDKWIKFYSKGAKKVKDGTTIKTKGKAENRNSGNNGKQVKWNDDGKKGTSAVNNSTSLKDGTYKPDKFSWSGGSGRLKYIRCTKITVKGGKAYATIEFGSSKYDSLRANGRTYSRSGGGNSKFTIPVKLNANNTIVGRTTAMSQPHWIRYSIYIYKKGAGAGKSGAGEGDDGHMTSTRKLSSKAPDLMGLEFKEEVEVKYAKYFKIFKYEQGITLIEIDQASDTALYKDEKKKDKSKEKGEGAEGGDEDLGHVEYDDEGNIIAQSQNEIVDGLYQNNIVNYIVVPKDVEIPAGLDKDGIILQQPIEKSFLASEKAADVLEQLGLLDKVTTVGFDAEKDGSDELRKALEAENMVLAGTADKPDYAALVKAEADMGIFPSMVLPEKLDKEPSEDEKAEVEEKTENIGVLRKRFAALGTPMMIDRSDDEKTNYASAEWIKVYGAVFGKEQEAGIIFDKYVADNKKENNEQ